MALLPIPEVIAKELAITLHQITATVALLDDGNTIPFIARYRKEVTGGLDEVQIRQIQERLDYLRKLAERREAVKAEIASQGKLTDELSSQLDAAATLQAVEDLYRPYKPKRQTRAAIARERGLESLAQALLAQARGAGDKATPLQLAAGYLTDQAPDIEAALAGARDIIAEQVSDDPATRQVTRQRFAADGFVISQRAGDAADAEGRYRVYYEFRAALAAVQPHQWLALQRGSEDGSLKVRIETPDGQISARIATAWIKTPGSKAAEQVRLAVEDGYERLLRPSVEREVSGQLNDYADDHAIQVFAANLRNLLLQPPLRERAVVGIDPGFRTGCKIATVDPTGKLLHTATIYPHEPRNDREKSLRVLAGLVQLDKISVIAIGNGTASRETEALVVELIQGPQINADDRGSDHQEHPRLSASIRGATASHLAYVMVSEAGASVYSASDIARAEFPDLDVSMRGAVSIARRLQDPLAELVKIDPQSIGVGLYQHDVDQKKLAAAVDAVVESVVNYVGVDANTASAALLGYVSGISKRVAGALVAHRDENGPFGSRAELKKVKGLGPKAFEQAAGFLRVPGSRNPLDNTTIHPESYDAAKALLDLAGLNLRMADLPGRLRKWCEENGLGLTDDGRRTTNDEGHNPQYAVRNTDNWSTTASLLNIGELTLRDIVAALLRPGRDPREDLPPVILRRDVLSIDDLREGMVLKGTVRNVVDFGAFVDIGVKQDGLVHVSKMAKKYVRNPHEVVGVGDIVDVTVISIDRGRGRVGLSMVG
ncbi:MAG: Tex family protein [Chloroflexi bacterium]|nr:Tex family protein [Chloroflexota bacterium]